MNEGKRRNESSSAISLLAASNVNLASESRASEPAKDHDHVLILLLLSIYITIITLLIYM